ncbi:hypothetical protein OUZ56_020910 [Daphnia magna]|uniref:Uncharacterized protein n=1 Tax=Daphnia magna TaxID=35525 RepID=A0ABQ9ZFT5_9CRUS|nr:hypothetical protein OUZ56_020910 [Daphnia magna]
MSGALYCKRPFTRTDRKLRVGIAHGPRILLTRTHHDSRIEDISMRNSSPSEERKDTLNQTA